MDQKEWDEDSNTEEDLTPKLDIVLGGTGTTIWSSFSSSSSSTFSSSITLNASGVYYIPDHLNEIRNIVIAEPEYNPTVNLITNIKSWIKHLWSKFIRRWDE